MELGLRGRKALITGGSKGIGLATASRLAAEGCDVTIVARTAADLDAARERIAAQHNVAVHGLAFDLSDSRNVDRLAGEAPEIDILVNNAGAIPGGSIEEIDEVRWRAAWDLKVYGYINMTRRFYAAMKSRGRGVIVNVIGSGGERLDADYIAGASGNASLMAFTRALGGSSPRDGIRVVGINPGPVATDRLVTLLQRRAANRFGDPARWRELLQTMPFGRAASADEIAAMAAFLASDLSAYTSGTIVTIDGGLANRAGA